MIYQVRIYDEAGDIYNGFITSGCSRPQIGFLINRLLEARGIDTMYDVEVKALNADRDADELLEELRVMFDDRGEFSLDAR